MAIAGQSRLPVWGTIKDAYRHLWYHRWRYTAQLLVGSLGVLALTLLTDLVIQFFWMPLGLGPANYFRYAAYIIATILSLIGCGGTMFLSCGRAILFHRVPLTTDVVRVQRFGRFWSVLFCYWFLAHLGPTIASAVIDQQGAWGLSWLNTYVVYAGYWISVLPIATALAMSMPIAAFEIESSPLRQGWMRSRGNLLRLAAIALIASVPTMAAEEIVFHAWPVVLVELLGSETPPDFIVSIVAWLFKYVESLMSLLIILVLSAVTLSAYARLSPRFEHVGRIFD